MSTDFEKGLRKTIDLSVKSKELTADVLKSAMQDFLSGKSRRKGRVSMKQLSEHSGKLENVEIKGIGDFLSVAKKYDIDYAVKKEANSDTFHVFFQAGKMEDFRRAFQEFASRKQEELFNPRAEITRQQIKVKLSITLDTLTARILKLSSDSQSRIESMSFYSWWDSTDCRADSAVTPVAHKISPYHCF